MTPALTGTLARNLAIVLSVAACAAPALAEESEEPPLAGESEAPAEAERETAEARAAERDALQPSVPSAVLAAEVERDTDDGRVMDRMDLSRTEITGNQELPKVLYIVPWQKSDPGQLMGKPVNRLLDEVLAPIDRGEFLRRVDYYDDLHGQDDEQ